MRYTPREIRLSKCIAEVAVCTRKILSGQLVAPVGVIVGVRLQEQDCLFEAFYSTIGVLLFVKEKSPKVRIRLSRWIEGNRSFS
jgi:hypothetical protein